ncbi:XdhC/CoxI family protein [Peribacillus saganii]|uniref:XdhC/CoxI family protein n=1 Tax=Peribacillus saganii TaxID=2303992 RepID=A0A372LRD6_9BACI|nr:XdhC/CoxI family protein [Peribacillus saganii]RFU70487.1 XdhC/CoxI family protein [Peribacillus saganii]
MSSLKELQNIFIKMDEVWERGEEAALLMITEVRGSSYRRPGTKIMISSDGEVYGTLSGGCLENDLIEYAKVAILENRPATKSYNLSENDLWGLGIGCKGALEIVILPIKKTSVFWREVKQEAFTGQLLNLVLNIDTGEGSLLNQHNQVIVQNGEYIPSTIINELFFVQKQYRQSAKVMIDEQNRYIVDTIFPLEKLIVSGAGHDAIPVVEFALKANFDVYVLDPRTQFNDEKRFPGANHWVADPSNNMEIPASLRNSWWIIMNHHMERDGAALKLAMDSNPKYVGVLGPAKRTEELLETNGIEIIDQPLFAPIGLDLGGETVEEVGISIVSELLAVRNQRSSCHLKGKNKIHA